METLNMSKLNLSSIQNNLPNESCPKSLIPDVKFDTIALIDPDDDHHFEYWKEIWETLLEQDAQKSIIHFQSPQLKFRGALVQQLRAVSTKLDLSLATVHTAVALLDAFMDSHILRDDRLTHVTLACLSLAAKSEEKFSKAPTLKTLSKVSGVQLCGKTFRQLEWMVGQHVRWRLLSPTPVTFAALLAQYVVADSDLVTRHPKFVRKFKKDGSKLLEKYLDLTLSNVRLKVTKTSAVGCACVASARAELGLVAWPSWLASLSGTDAATVAPVAHLLQRMMKFLKSRESVETEVDQGYSSAKTSPNITPHNSPKLSLSPASSTCSSSTRSYMNVDTSHRQDPLRSDPYLELDETDVNIPNGHDYYRLPATVDLSCHRVNNPVDYRYCKTNRLIEASYNKVQQSTGVAVKRGMENNVELDRKRYRLTTQMSQVVL